MAQVSSLCSTTAVLVLEDDEPLLVNLRTAQQRHGAASGCALLSSSCRESRCVLRRQQPGGELAEGYSLHQMDFDLVLLAQGKDLVSPQKRASFICK